MQVKTFEGISLKDAIRLVRQDFGPDAVILSTKERPMSGNPQTKVFEVTAAMPEAKNIGASGKSAVHDWDGETVRQIMDKMQAMDLRLATIVDALPSNTLIQNLETGIKELKVLLLESLRAKDGSVLSGLPAAMVPVERQLRAMGVDDVYLAQLLKHLLASPPITASESAKTPEGQEAHYRAQAVRWMMSRLKIYPKWNLVPGTTAVHAFIGTSGVGKTSMVAKLAAHYHLKEKTSVLVASYDSARIAGSEQLRVYAKVIGVPFMTFSNPSELTNRLLEHRDIDLVVIDTGGKSPKDSRAIGDLMLLRNANIPIDFHLLLSIAEKQDQLERTIRYFSPVSLHSLAFSRLDESWSYGEIFNLSSRWSLPLSFFSTGQEVPDDVERASRERVIERLFGL